MRSHTAGQTKAELIGHNEVRDGKTVEGTGTVWSPDLGGASKVFEK